MRLSEHTNQKKNQHKSLLLIFKSASLGLVLLTFSGCTMSWESRKFDLRSVWADVTTYDRFSIAFERRHHFPPANSDTNDYRWLHGPMPAFSCSPVAATGQSEVIPQAVQSEQSYSDTLSQLMRVPAESSGSNQSPVELMRPNLESHQPPVAPYNNASPLPSPHGEPLNSPVEIMIPPLEPLQQPESSRPFLDGPTAFQPNRNYRALPVHATEIQQR